MSYLKQKEVESRVNDWLEYKSLIKKEIDH